MALDACFENLKRLNDELSEKYVLLGNGLKPSEADVIVYLVIHSSLVCISHSSYLLSEYRTASPPLVL